MGRLHTTGTVPFRCGEPAPWGAAATARLAGALSTSAVVRTCTASTLEGRL